MQKLKDLYNKYLGHLNKYWVVGIVFVILTFTAGDSSLYKRYTYDEKIRSLENEIEHYRKEIEINSKKLKAGAFCPRRIPDEAGERGYFYYQGGINKFPPRVQP